MPKNKKILMVSAENDALPGAKVGGVGDVLRDLPKALIKKGANVDCVIPSYGFLSRLPKLEKVGEVRFSFASKFNTVDVFKLKGKKTECDFYILHHEEFYIAGEEVYHNDLDGRPFATDARKFAFFCTALANALLQELVPRPDFLHCHDWHTAFLLILLKFDRTLQPLLNIKTVFTIHNLAMQGTRPFKSDTSSFDLWFPKLPYSPALVRDPRYTDCVNPMRAGILLADCVNTVSPSYAEEILLPSDQAHGIYGGDGLESDIQTRKRKGDLIGILNGCEYPSKGRSSSVSKSKLVSLMQSTVEVWASNLPHVASAHWLADKHIERWSKQKQLGVTITSIGRLTEQKVRLLHTDVEPGVSALEAILQSLGNKGSLIMLGSGNQDIEQFILRMAARFDNLIFLNGYSSELSHALYNFGDLFLMPSSYEPCGISQMLAMKAGQPCLVNGVGGLKDTVEHDKNGFVFKGNGAQAQAKAMVTLFREVVSLYNESPGEWKKVASAAEKTRFTWEASADQYIAHAYR